MSDNTLFEVDDTLTVGQINRRLGEAVRRTFSNEVWVQGQIRNLSRSSRGHVYFDLVDPVAAGEQPKASIAVTLFDSARKIVNRTITRTGNSVRIDDGVEVRIKAKVEMYQPRGQVQLNMTSIDPEFTLGRLGADRDQLLRELKAEGLIGANSRVPMPLVPLRVGLITSGGSAAHADFQQQVAASGYAFEILMLSTRVQGEYAPEEIAEMIIHGCELDVDVLAVVRGGGARTDLAAFDTEPVARAIANATMPVICGIGHEIDTSIADLVAHASFTTPTACARHLIERVIDFDFVLAERAGRIAERARVLPRRHEHEIAARGNELGKRLVAKLSAAELRTSRAATNVERRVVRTMTMVEQRLATRRNELSVRTAGALQAASHRGDRNRDELSARPARALRGQLQRIDLLDARLSAVDPVQALRRGYSITTTAAGELVRSADSVEIGDTLVTRLAAGSVTSTVDSLASPSNATQD